MTTARDSLNAFLDLPEIPVPNAESGALAGLTLAVKDIFDVAGYKTGGGNPQKAADAPTRTAPAVQMLLDAGARFVGKTQTDELAFSLVGQNAHFPQPVNPAAPDRVTGGSSSGSAAAVAGRLADIATGSDTGGSIRAPASFCGLIGLRTTHGRIPLDGTMPLVPSMDTFGWFAKDIATYEAVARVLLGNDDDETVLNRPLSLGVLDAQIAGPAETAEYESSRAKVARIVGEPQRSARLTHAIDDLYWCFRKLQGFEAWAAHGAWISQKDRGLGPGVKERFEFGSTVTRETAAAEAKRRADFRAELSLILGDGGFLVLPTVPGPAPLRSLSFNATQAYRERALHLLCLSGLSGFPQITLPLGSVDKAPFGISLLGPPNSDLALVRLGRRILESAGRA
jgi:amidase